MCISELENHVDNCQFNKAECEAKCGFSGSKSQLREHNCVQYLSEKLATATSLNNKLTNEVAVAKNQIMTEAKVMSSSAAKVNSFLQSIKFNYKLLWHYFLSVPEHQSLSLNVLFQYQDDNTFDLDDKEAIARVVVSSIVQRDATYCSLANRISKKLNKKIGYERYWHVMVGAEFSYSLYPRKYMLFRVADIRVAVFVQG